MTDDITVIVPSRKILKKCNVIVDEGVTEMLMIIEVIATRNRAACTQRKEIDIAKIIESNDVLAAL